MNDFECINEAVHRESAHIATSRGSVRTSSHLLPDGRTHLGADELAGPVEQIVVALSQSLVLVQALPKRDGIWESSRSTNRHGTHAY